MLFLLRNTNASTCLGFKQVLSFETVIPALEKILSKAVEVSGTHNTSRTTLLMRGNLCLCSFHQLTGLLFRDTGALARWKVLLWNDTLFLHQAEYLEPCIFWVMAQLLKHNDCWVLLKSRCEQHS